MRVVLSSGPEAQELAMIEEILSQSPTRVPVTNFAGKLTLKDIVGAHFLYAKALICVDSGAAAYRLGLENARCRPFRADI